MNTTYHQLCSSDFVQESWILFLFADTEWRVYARADIWVRVGAYFRYLSTNCNLTQATINNTLAEFLDATFIIAQVMSEEEFDVPSIL